MYATVKLNKIPNRHVIPKLFHLEIINRMKLSFIKDTNASVNDFVGKLLNHNSQSKGKDKSFSISGFAQEIYQIDNPSLLQESFYHNTIGFKGSMKKPRLTCRLYQEMIFADVLRRESFRYNNELDSFQMVLFVVISDAISVLSVKYATLRVQKD
jgi:hypothetical protein